MKHGHPVSLFVSSPFYTLPCFPQHSLSSFSLRISIITTPFLKGKYTNKENKLVQEVWEVPSRKIPELNAANECSVQSACWRWSFLPFWNKQEQKHGGPSLQVADCSGRYAVRSVRMRQPSLLSSERLWLGRESTRACSTGRPPGRRQTGPRKA